MARTDMTNESLKPAQYRAVTQLVLSGGNVPAAAQAAEVSERTLRRWMATPTFKNELVEAEGEAIRAAARRLGRLADKALGVLEGVMDKTSAPDHARIRAAATVLDCCLRWREAADLESRVCKLEQALEAKP